MGHPFSCWCAEKAGPSTTHALRASLRMTTFDGWLLNSSGRLLVAFCSFAVQRDREDEQADAGDVESFCVHQVFGALAEVGHADVGVAAQFETGGDQDAVDF